MVKHSHAVPITHNLPSGALWPYKHTMEELGQIKASNPYVYASQYTQNPSPKGGGIFKDKWWRRYDVQPYLYSKIITADTAQKTKEYNDYSVLQCWGKGDQGIYLLDQIRGKWEADALIAASVDFFTKHNTAGVHVSGFYIEDKSSGTGLIQTLRNGKTTQVPVPVRAVQRNVDKVTRAHGVVSYLASGFVHLPRSREWVNDFIMEHTKFTALMNHKHDDQIDPTMDAIEILLIKGFDCNDEEGSMVMIESANGYEGDIC